MSTTKKIRSNNKQMRIHGIIKNVHLTQKNTEKKQEDKEME